MRMRGEEGAINGAYVSVRSRAYSLRMAWLHRGAQPRQDLPAGISIDEAGTLTGLHLDDLRARCRRRLPLPGASICPRCSWCGRVAEGATP